MLASPGYPYCLDHPTNGDLIKARGPEFLVQLVRRRLEEAFHTGKLESDYVRYFVKGEAHKLAKVKEGRFRLIASLSVVDQLIDRLVFDFQLLAEIENSASIPVKNGLDFLRGGLDATFKRLRWGPKKHMCWKDVRAWDWHFKDWMYDFYYDLKRRICRNWSEDEDFFQFIFRQRISCVANAKAILSSGQTYEQTIAAVMRSGWLCTLSCNSNCNVGLKVLYALDSSHEFIPEVHQIIAIGDDALEALPEGEEEEYKAWMEGQGFTLKHCESGPLERAEWCSRNFALHNGNWVWWTQNIEKFIWNLQNAETKSDMDNVPAKLLGYCIDTCWAQPPRTKEDHFSVFHSLLRQYGGTMFRSRDWIVGLHTGNEAATKKMTLEGTLPAGVSRTLLIRSGLSENPGPNPKRQRARAMLRQAMPRFKTGNPYAVLAGAAAAKHGALEPVRDAVDKADDALHAGVSKLPAWAQTIASPVVAVADVARAVTDVVLPRNKEVEMKTKVNTSATQAVEQNPGPPKGASRAGKKAKAKAVAKRPKKAKRVAKRVKVMKGGRHVATKFTRSDLIFSGTISNNSGNGLPPGTVLYSTLINPNGTGSLANPNTNGIAAMALNYEAKKWELFDCTITFEVKCLGSDYVAGTYTGVIEPDPTDGMPSGVDGIQRAMLMGGKTYPWKQSGRIGYSAKGRSKATSKFFVSQNNSDPRLTSKGKFWLMVNEYPQTFGNTGTSTPVQIPIQVFAHYTFHFSSPTLEPDAGSPAGLSSFMYFNTTGAINQGANKPFNFVTNLLRTAQSTLQNIDGMVAGDDGTNDWIVFPTGTQWDNYNDVSLDFKAGAATISNPTQTASVGSFVAQQVVTNGNSSVVWMGLLSLSATPVSTSLQNAVQFTKAKGWQAIGSWVGSAWGAVKYLAATFTTADNAFWFTINGATNYNLTLSDRQLMLAGPGTVEWEAAQSWDRSRPLRDHCEEYLRAVRKEQKSAEALASRLVEMEAELEAERRWRTSRRAAALLSLQEDEPTGGSRPATPLDSASDGFEHVDRKDPAGPAQETKAGAGGQGRQLHAAGSGPSGTSALSLGAQRASLWRHSIRLREDAGGAAGGASTAGGRPAGGALGALSGGPVREEGRGQGQESTPRGALSSIGAQAPRT